MSTNGSKDYLLTHLTYTCNTYGLDLERVKTLSTLTLLAKPEFSDEKY